MRLAHIVAMSKNRVIGVDGGMPWHLPEDLKFFRRKTTGHAVIMGRKTFLSIGRDLPNRHNIVLTRNPPEEHNKSTQYATSIGEAIELAELGPRSDKGLAFIIGGGQIYKETINLVDEIYQTEVELEIEGDTLYPVVSDREFRLVSRDSLDSYPAMTFKKFLRITER